ncbi:MAG: vitamin B12 dependent-methionine synthase activation domain-containing protein [Candidatus Coproplasma sp.]
MKILTGKLKSIDRGETLRYLGYRRQDTPAEEISALLSECESLALAAQDLKAVYGIYDISLGQPLDLGFTRVKSYDLEKNLAGCNKIVMFAATAGIGIDRLIARYSVLSPARAAVLQAMGAALVEGWCDELHASFISEYGANKSRFSCGFGDLPLTLQRDIFAALCVTKNIGITLSDNCFMTPTKSVTAIIGIKEQ